MNNLVWFCSCGHTLTEYNIPEGVRVKGSMVHWDDVQSFVKHCPCGELMKARIEDSKATSGANE